MHMHFFPLTDGITLHMLYITLLYKLYIVPCNLLYHLIIYHGHPFYFTTHRIILFFWGEYCCSLKF